MHMRFMTRLLTVSLLFVLVVAGSLGLAANAKSERSHWFDTSFHENALVQSCDGFNVSTSYITSSAHHLIAHESGDRVVEQVNVVFAGALGNAETGRSYLYDGQLTKVSNYLQHHVTTTALNCDLK